MSEPKEFLGKTLDAAIAEACAYYDLPREKLEIEIIEDAKTGIFGIVGARKAKIRARLATLPDFMQSPSAPKQERGERQEGRRRSRNERKRDKTELADAQKESGKESRRDIPKEAPAQDTEASDNTPDRDGNPALPAVLPPVEQPWADMQPSEAPAADEDQPVEPAKGRQSRQPRQPRAAAPRRESSPRSEEADALETVLPRIPLVELDQDRLTEHTRTIISRLVAPILDMEPESVDLSLEIGEDRMQVSVKSEDTGLLIGRDGQNLAAVQYLASRMITRAVGAQVRIQVDAGDYHVRQDSRLQELALSLAEKVKATGKVQTTRPLSAYQRRVIHLALQDDPEVQTRSSGEGALKHVVILRRKD